MAQKLQKWPKISQTSQKSQIRPDKNSRENTGG